MIRKICSVFRGTVGFAQGLVGLVLLVAFTLVFNALFASRASQTASFPETSYVKGEILITFKPGTTFKEAKNLLNDLKLQYEEPYLGLNSKQIQNDVPYDINVGSPVAFKVYVPEGEEMKWIGILNKYGIVRTAGLDYLLEIIH